jgi:hypothetical protein
MDRRAESRLKNRTNDSTCHIIGALTIAADTGQELKALWRMSEKRVKTPKKPYLKIIL